MNHINRNNKKLKIKLACNIGDITTAGSGSGLEIMLISIEIEFKSDRIV